jgi:hypothetical protein
VPAGFFICQEEMTALVAPTLPSNGLARGDNALGFSPGAAVPRRDQDGSDGINQYN